MNIIYQKNLEFLKVNYPIIYNKILNHRPTGNYRLIITNYPNVKYKNRYIHSNYAPEREARILTDNINRFKNIVFLFLGLGFGYHVKYFISKNKSILNQSQIIIVEKDIELFDILLHIQDISYLKGVSLLIDPTPDELHFYFQYLNPVNFSGYRIIKLPGCISIHKDFFNDVEKTFKNIVGSKLTDILTRFAFETLWLKNSIDNLHYLPESSPINSIKGAGKNRSVIVVGAGPSLFYQLDILKEISRYIFIIAVDTALTPLLNYDIYPDIIVTLDAQAFSQKDFLSLSIKNKKDYNPYLIYDLFSYPGVIKNFKGKKIFTASSNSSLTGNGKIIFIDNPIINHIKKNLLNFDSIPCGGSVLTNAIEIAQYIEFERVIIVGADFAYTDYKTHINSAPHYNHYFLKSNKINTINSFNIAAITARKPTKLKEAITDYVLKNYKSWIESRNYKNTFNATFSGLDIKNMEKLNLSSLKKELKIKKSPLEIVLKNPEKSSINNFLNNLKIMLERVVDGKDAAITIINNEVTDNYYFLNNILFVAKYLYRNDKSMLNNYLYNLAKYLLKRVDKIIQKL